MKFRKVTFVVASYTLKTGWYKSLRICGYTTAAIQDTLIIENRI